MARAKTSITLKSYIMRRLAVGIPLIIGSIIFSFLLIHLAPGDPVSYFVGEMGADPEYIAEIRAKYGLDKPILDQLITYLSRIFRGDLGYSLRYRQPVSKLISERLPATVLLIASALSLSAIIGVTLGVIASRRPFHLVDNMITLFSLAGYSIPYFWSAIMLILIFATHLGWLPSGGFVSLRENLEGWAYYASIIEHMILPTLSLVIYHMALMARLTRGTMLEVLREDYIVTARSKGLPENKVLFSHALRNAIISPVTVLGYQFGLMFGGVVLTESIFAWPGLGRLMYNAVLGLDYPLVVGMLIFVSITMVTTNLITDIILAYLDPRIRYK